jgi:hypothetical protein
MSWVTRLAEFSPIGRLFTLGSFLKMTVLAHILDNFLLSKCLVLPNLDPKMGWAAFRAIFIQTHPVTLVMRWNPARV